MNNNLAYTLIFIFVVLYKYIKILNNRHEKEKLYILKRIYNRTEIMEIENYEGFFIEFTMNVVSAGKDVEPLDGTDNWEDTYEMSLNYRVIKRKPYEQDIEVYKNKVPFNFFESIRYSDTAEEVEIIMMNVMRDFKDLINSDGYLEVIEKAIKIYSK